MSIDRVIGDLERAALFKRVAALAELMPFQEAGCPRRPTASRAERLLEDVGEAADLGNAVATADLERALQRQLDFIADLSLRQDDSRRT